jgi:hypothetical protein
MKKLVSTLGLISALALVASPAQARWAVDYDPVGSIFRMVEDDLLQTRADGYFLISADEITTAREAAPTAPSKYAVIIGGVALGVALSALVM